MGEANRPQPKPSVLIAEDNEMNQRLIRRFLQGLNCDVDAVATGREAVEAVQRADYLLVLMDVRMPELNGLDATRQIRSLPLARQPHIYALTAGVAPDEQQACLDAGMEGFLAKPLDREQLERLLADLA